MTVSNLNNKHVYTGNGVTVNWPYTFPIIESSDILLYKTDSAGAITPITSRYSIDQDAATVTYPTNAVGLDPVMAPLTSSEKITILRSCALDQEIDLKNQGPLNAEVLEQEFDKLTMISQQLQEQVGRCIRYSVDESPSSAETEGFLLEVQAARDAALAAQTSAGISASAALISETNAGDSESAAAISETNAGISASNAADSEAGAAAAATAAAASVVGTHAALTATHGVAGSIVGTSDTQALTNKDIDGGTASNSNRITLPKNTTTNLSGLTRKQASIFFDTDLGSPVIDTGSALIQIGSGEAQSFKSYSSDPTGAESKVYFNSTSKKFLGHNGTSWGEIGGGKYSANTRDQTGTTIALTDQGLQKWRYTGSSAITLTAFTLTNVVDGASIIIIGSSDLYTLTIPSTATGIAKQNGNIELGLGQSITYLYDSVVGLIETSRT
jgi:hypothetical protein